MAKDKTNELMDTATARAALSEIKDIKSEKAFDAALAKVAAAQSAQQGERKMMSLAFAWGRYLRSQKTAFAKGQFDKKFDAYAKDHWSDSDRPGEASLKQYRSRYGAFCEAGMVTWNAEPLVEKVIAIKAMNLSDRASRMRSLTSENGKPFAAPPAEKIVQSTLFPADDNTPSAADTVLKGLINSGVNAARNPNFVAMLAKDGALAAIFRPILDELVNQRAIAARANTNKKSAAEQMAGVDEARKLLAKIKGDDDKPRSRRNLN